MLSTKRTWLNLLFWIIFFSYEEDEINKLPGSSVRPIARTALTWDQVGKKHRIIDCVSIYHFRGGNVAKWLGHST